MRFQIGSLLWVVEGFRRTVPSYALDPSSLSNEPVINWDTWDNRNNGGNRSAVSALSESSLREKSKKASLKNQDRELIESRWKFYESVLFKDVQLKGGFADSKTFVDATPLYPLQDIMRKYEKLVNETNEESRDLTKFVNENFEMPGLVAENMAAQIGNVSILEYIESTWDKLTKNFTVAEPGSSLITLANPTLVPGGRFREWYYWDSFWPVRYFLRSQQKSKIKLAVGMLKNIESLLERFDFIPNGNRDYYLKRSQAPIFSMMIEELMLLNDEAALPFLAALEKEFVFWSRPDEEPVSGEIDVQKYAGGRARTFKGDMIFVYDSGAGGSPRPEAFKEDYTAYQSTMVDGKSNHPDIYRDIQASCESGWDFATRFSAGCHPTKCLITSQIAPVDLQAFLIHSAYMLSKLYQLKEGSDAIKEDSKTSFYHNLVEKQTKTLNDHFFDETRGVYSDIYWRDGEFVAHTHAAMIVPLAFGLADDDRANRTLEYVTDKLLRAGGILVTDLWSDQQWDAPYGWAPLQWFYTTAARRYGRDDLADEVEKRWTRMVKAVYKETGWLYEKYDIINQVAGSGGEYEVQTGFAFTNAVTAEFIERQERKKSS